MLRWRRDRWCKKYKLDYTFFGEIYEAKWNLSELISYSMFQGRLIFQFGPPIIFPFLSLSLSYSFRIQHLTNINPISNRQIAVVVFFTRNLFQYLWNFLFRFIFLFILFIFLMLENFHFIIIIIFFRFLVTFVVEWQREKSKCLITYHTHSQYV